MGDSVVTEGIEKNAQTPYPAQSSYPQHRGTPHTDLGMCSWRTHLTADFGVVTDTVAAFTSLY